MSTARQVTFGFRLTDFLESSKLLEEPVQNWYYNYCCPRVLRWQEAVEATNVALATKVSRFREGKHRLETQIQRRRDQYCRLFGPPIKTAPAGRKGTTYSDNMGILPQKALGS